MYNIDRKLQGGTSTQGANMHLDPYKPLCVEDPLQDVRDILQIAAQGKMLYVIKGSREVRVFPFKLQGVTPGHMTILVYDANVPRWVERNNVLKVFLRRGVYASEGKARAEAARRQAARRIALEIKEHQTKAALSLQAQKDRLTTVLLWWLGCATLVGAAAATALWLLFTW
jgi:hypothetical protein